MYPQKKRPPRPPQPTALRQPQQDPLVAAILYLSPLHHEQPYSDQELAQAIERCRRSYPSPVDLSIHYGQSLSAGSRTTAATVRERRAWALRIAADLAHRHPRDGSLPWASATTLSDALESAGVQRTIRRARRHALLVAAPIIVLYLLISGLSEAGRDVMALSVAGPLNVGLCLGLLHLVAVAAWVQWYARHCVTSIDPLVESLGTPAGRPEQPEPRP
ncbi:DUF485 domain-containing protein [Streptomyces sp. NPDC002643]